MALGKRTKSVQQELVMDMTPMIDCVFLLMIFFVLVIDLSQQTLEDLILPKAKYAVPDEKPPQNRPVVNIMQDGRVLVKKNVRYDPVKDGDNFSSIHTLLTEMRDNIPDLDVEKKVVGGTAMTLINDPLLIRADKWTEWHYVGKFMEACVYPPAAFWKLELALSEIDKEAKMLGKPYK
jgi:biopolymer transport protein ExbD